MAKYTNLNLNLLSLFFGILLSGNLFAEIDSLKKSLNFLPDNNDKIILLNKYHLEINNNTDAFKTYYNIGLSNLNSTKDKFFSIIAHDLKNPLGNLKKVTNLLHDEYDTFTEEDRKEFVELMKESSTNIYVKDSGLGMSQQTIDELFRIDVNVTSKGTNNESGTGLGLILC